MVVKNMFAKHVQSVGGAKASREYRPDAFVAACKDYVVQLKRSLWIADDNLYKEHQRRKAGTTLIVSSSGCKTQLQKATIGESQTPFVTRVSKNAQECTQAMVHNVIQLWYESHALFQATNSIEFGEQPTLMIL